jgi:hypothetical protein
MTQQEIRGILPIKAHFYQPILPGDMYWCLEQFILMIPAMLDGKSDIRYSYGLDPVTNIRAVSFYGAIQATQD